MRRVFITGIGPVSNIGTGVSAFTEGLRSGRSGVSTISSFDLSGFPRRLGGEVKDFAPDGLIRNLDPDRWGRSSLLAAAAARLAVEDGGLDEQVLTERRSGVVIGTTSGESRVVDEIGERVARAGHERMPREAVRKLPAARLSAAVSEEFGLYGESVTIATACAAGNYALGYAFDAVASGRAEFMLAGGADSVCRWAHAGFVRLGAVAEEACAPFDRDRSGIVTAEGGAMLLLESAA
ncbi:MAG TPA: beta-ketoacyl synthase N-terminal-like domain-containing protein, partial [Kribbella sp.]